MKTMVARFCLVFGLMFLLSTVNEDVHQALATVPEDDIPAINYEYGNVLFGEGGWITGLVFHPQEELMYIRTDVGGTYRFDGALESWIALNDDLPASLWTWYSIDGIAIDPNDANIVYAAVGHASNEQNTYPKGTILKSINQGESWTKLPIDLYFSGNGDLRWVGERIAVDPYHSDRILVGSRKEGLWASGDGGETWNLTTFPGILKNDYGVTALLFDQQQQGVVYAAAYGDGIYRSDDSGTNWTKLPGVGNPERPARMVLSNSGTLYVTTERNDQGVLKWDNGVWVNLTPDSNLVDYSNNPAGYNGISIHPLNEQQIVASPHNMGGVLFETDNGGETWRRIDISNSELQSDIPWMKPLYWAASIGALEFDPYHNNRVWLTDWHGIWKTEDITASTVLWEQLQSGHEEMTTRSVKSIPLGTRVTIGGADMGGGVSFYYDEYPERIDNMGMSEIYDWDFMESGPSHVVMVGGSKVSGTGAFSSDGGETWTKFPTSPSLGSLATKVAMSSTNPNLFLVTTSNYSVFRTNDQGHTWTEIMDLPTTALGPWTWSQVLKSDRLNGEKFYFFDFKTGDFYRSINGGLNFTKTATLPLPQDKRWIYIQPSFTTEGELWISLDDQGLFRSTDSGNSFARIDKVEKAFNIALGKSAQNSTNPTLYMYGIISGTEGMFRTLDNGQSWQNIGIGDTGFGNRPQAMDASKQVFGLVFVGTTGRGVRYGKEENSDIIPPKINFDSMNLYVNQPEFTVSGVVNEPASIKVNGNIAIVNNELQFLEQVMLQPGDNVIEVEATDVAGNSVIKKIKVTYDTTPPVMMIDQVDETVRQGEYLVSGRLNKPGKVEIQGNIVTVASDLTFSRMVTLQSGTNSITVIPRDKAGNQGDSAILTIEYLPIHGFDLIVTEIGVEEDDYREGDDVHFYAIVKNQGSTATPLEYIMVHFIKDHDDAIERTGSNGTRWYPSNGNQSSTALALAYTNIKLSIAPGESVKMVANQSYNIPIGGSHFKLMAIADATSKFLTVEDDRENNTYATMVSSSLITDFFVGTQVGNSTIDTTNRQIEFQLNVQSQNKFLHPIVGLMPGSTIDPTAGSLQNFETPVEYTITTANGINYVWTVKSTFTDEIPTQFFDLAVTEVGVDNKNYAPGDPVRLYAVIENKGNIATPLQYVNVHFVIGATTALEKGDKKWYPNGGNMSSTALRVGDANQLISIAPGPENAVMIYSTGNYTILERLQSFNLLGIVDASGKFYDVEHNRKNNYLSSLIKSELD